MKYIDMPFIVENVKFRNDLMSMRITNNHSNIPINRSMLGNLDPDIFFYINKPIDIFIPEIDGEISYEFHRMIIDDAIEKAIANMEKAYFKHIEQLKPWDVAVLNNTLPYAFNRFSRGSLHVEVYHPHLKIDTAVFRNEWVYTKLGVNHMINMYRINPAMISGKIVFCKDHLNNYPSLDEDLIHLIVTYSDTTASEIETMLGNPPPEKIIHAC